MNKWIRKLHRVVAVVFTLVVVTLFYVQATQATPPEWVFLVPGGLLVLLWLSGAYLYLLPWVARLRKSPTAEIAKAD